MPGAPAGGLQVTAGALEARACAHLAVHCFDDLDIKPRYLLALRDREKQVDVLINSYVAARSVCTLYELEQHLCEAERVEKYEELKLGPLLKHRLVLKYFSPAPSVAMVPEVGALRCGLTHASHSCCILSCMYRLALLVHFRAVSEVDRYCVVAVMSYSMCMHTSCTW